MDKNFRESDVLLKVQKRLASFLGAYRQQLSKMRTGRASPLLIESVSVACYGGARSLKSVAQVATEGAVTLLVTPYDPSIASAIEKALLNANLGVGVKRSAQVLLVTFPPLTQERRVDLIKEVKAASEQVAIGMRNARREGNEELKTARKEKLITEDVQKKCEKLIQKYLDESILALLQETKQKTDEMMQL